MQKHLILCLLFSLMLGSCTAPAASTPAVILPSPTFPATASPTLIPPIGMGRRVNLTSIHMDSETGGWAETNIPDRGAILLHTLDGGQSWKEVTPAIVSNGSFEAAFLDERTAWVYAADSSGNNASLARTLDGGSTWETINRALPDSFVALSAGMTFLDRDRGWAEVYDVGAGQAHIQVFITRDGGHSWDLVPMQDPQGTSGEPAGSLHLCNICGDNFYYDPARQIITYGDLASDPVGSVRGSISFDQGQTWKDFKLPFPSASFADALVAPQAPVFFSRGEGVLPVGLVKLNADGTHAYDVLAIYTTRDGGASWTPDPVLLENVSNLLLSHAVVDFVSSQAAFVPCGAELCATNDSLHTWQPLQSNLNFSYSESTPDYVEQLDFISPSMGWAISSSGDSSSLWKTRDGGHTWEEIRPMLTIQ